MNLCPKCQTELKFHDGFLGYEAIYCSKCGYFADHEIEGQDNAFIEKKIEVVK
jgi:hypothetical protein